MLQLEALKGLLRSGRKDEHSLGVVIYGSSAYHNIIQVSFASCESGGRSGAAMVLAPPLWHPARPCRGDQGVVHGVSGGPHPSVHSPPQVCTFWAHIFSLSVSKFSHLGVSLIFHGFFDQILCPRLILNFLQSGLVCVRSVSLRRRTASNLLLSSCCQTKEV